MNRNDTHASLKEICSALESLLKAGGFHIEKIEVIKDVSTTIPRINILSQDRKLLTGHDGKTLEALTLLIRVMFEGKELEEQFILDVDGFQEKKIEGLSTTTRIYMKRAEFLKKEIPLPPLTAFERMIVHAIVQNEKGFSTRSEGVGRNRVLYITPAS